MESVRQDARTNGDDQLLSRSGVVERAAGEQFYSPLRPARGLFVLLEGRATVARLDREGRRLVVEVLEPGSVLGDLTLRSGGRDNEIVEALTDCRVLAIDPRSARELAASDPQLAIRILGAVADRLRSVSDRLEELAHNPVESRVASAVLRAAGPESRMALVSHQFLADMAGTYRETATRSLEGMQMRRLLELGRCAIAIRDREALADIARDR